MVPRIRRQAREALLCAACALCGGHALGERSMVPHLGERGQADYAGYLSAAMHRAFVIAPGGTWSWRADAVSAEAALEQALDDCRARTEQTCLPYAVDERVVFDARAWATAWGPYRSRAQAASSAVGRQVGERFHNLSLRDAAGRPARLADLRGKVVVLHFWGSWCRPCRHEMPDLQALRDSLAARRDIVFVLVQVRERFETSREWARAQGIRLPLYDSGSRGEEDESLRLVSGGVIRDRELARAFPTTYVLDKHGVVVFSHVGPVPRWSEYREFLLDAAARSGR